MWRAAGPAHACEGLRNGRCWVVKVYDVDRKQVWVKEKAASDDGLLLNGRRYVPGRSSALPVILSPRHESIHWINWMTRMTAMTIRPTITRSRYGYGRLIPCYPVLV